MGLRRANEDGKRYLDRLFRAENAGKVDAAFQGGHAPGVAEPLDEGERPTHGAVEQLPSA